MQINNIEFKNFRNFSYANIDFSPNINIIYGENGQGKTNILEGIYMCSLGKSHRRSRENEQIRFNQDEAHIKGEFIANNSPVRIDIHIKRNSAKGAAINRLPIRKISELFGRVRMIIFSPEDLNIIKGSPSARRSFINTELCQIDPIYVRDLINYTHLLKARNELLKQGEAKSDFPETIDVIDLQLADYGRRIIERRSSFLENLNCEFKKIHSEISGGKEEAFLRYEPSVKEENLHDELIRVREKDKIYKTTSVGPHRDDFSFFDKNKNLKVYGSQGQQRTSVLSLKLAELKIMTEKQNESPILLLDDVLSELDRNRQKQLLKKTEGIQTIITGTGLDEFMEYETADAKKFKVQDAGISV